MVDISNLADGSVIVAGGKDMTVSSVERDGSLVLINGGLTKGGMTLTTQDDGVYYELGVNDVKCYQEKGEVTLPLSAGFHADRRLRPRSSEPDLWRGETFRAGFQRFYHEQYARHD